MLGRATDIGACRLFRARARRPTNRAPRCYKWRRMFTGLVETTGTVSGRVARGPGHRLRIDTELSPLVLGESIAVNGVCLTVQELAAGGFVADVSLETHERTTLGRVALGSRVNLERSLRVGDRLGGHLVSGHVDGLARVVATEAAGDAQRVRLTAPAELLPFLAAKGSVTLDGVSLTVNAVRGSEFEIMLVPHTQSVTTLGQLRPSLELNLEVDLIARYVVHYLRAQPTTPADPGGTLAAALERAGFFENTR